MAISSEALSTKLDQIIYQYNRWRDHALADGHINLEETIEGHAQAIETLRDLRALKKEINYAIRTVRQEYREEINEAGTKFFGGKGKQQSLRLDLPYALEPYQRLLVSVDGVILKLDGVSQSFKETLAEAKTEAATERKSDKQLKARSIETEEAPAAVVVWNGIDPADIQTMTKKWGALLEETQRRLAEPNLRPEELHFRNGIIRALGLVVDDLQALIPEAPIT